MAINYLSFWVKKCFYPKANEQLKLSKISYKVGLKPLYIKEHCTSITCSLEHYSNYVECSTTVGYHIIPKKMANREVKNILKR